MTLGNNRPPPLSNIELCASFHHCMWIQTGVTVRRRVNWVLTFVTLTFKLWPWPVAWTSLLSMVITANFTMIWWHEHFEKGVTDRWTDGQTAKNMISSFHSDRAITYILFQCHIPLYILMKIIFRNIYSDVWRVAIFKAIIASITTQGQNHSYIMIWHGFWQLITAQNCHKIFSFWSMAIYIMLQLNKWLLLHVLNATCVYMKSWCSVLKWRPHAKNNNQTQSQNDKSNEKYIHAQTDNIFLHEKPWDWRVHRSVEFQMLLSHSQFTTARVPSAPANAGW